MPSGDIIYFRVTQTLTSDANETCATNDKSKQTPLILPPSWQNLPNLKGFSIECAARGKYMLCEVGNEDIMVFSSDTEVPIVKQAISSRQRIST
jgi:transketolase